MQTVTNAEGQARTTQTTRTVEPRRLPPASEGFLGPGHEAVEVIGPTDLVKTDPFVLLMDDRIAFEKGRKVGEAHPHAGLETVTFALEGTLLDEDEGALGPGDLVWMTAGRGVIHGEHMFATGERARILQLWITLPERDRHAAPRLDVVRAADVPVHRAPGVEAKLYSGESNGLRSSTKNYVPVTLVDVRLERGASFEQLLPASYGGFVLPIAGRVSIADETLEEGNIGWLDRGAGRLDSDVATHLVVRGDAPTSRFLLYAGRRQGEPTVQRGPFVAGSEIDIAAMFRAYRAGRFTPVSQLP